MTGNDAFVETARSFTRFFTRQTRLMDEAFLGSAFSLVEGRVLFELSRRNDISASTLRHALGLDAGYLSRTLTRLEEAGLLLRRSCPDDGRRQILSLTAAGEKAFAPLDQASTEQWRDRTSHLGADARARLGRAMAEIQLLLDGTVDSASIRLREHDIGDLGWVARRQGMLYAQEYGWDESFEALVAEILLVFVRQRDASRERGWIAEWRGCILGSIYCMAQSADVAKLRLLYVEPEARGTGLGSRLVSECIAFARERGYRRVTLWTNDCLHAARRIYVKAGFRLVSEEKHRSFGQDLVGQNWDLDL